MKGKTIMIQQDVKNPGSYSRSFLVSGIKGIAQKYPEEDYAFDPETHEFLNNNKMDSIMKLYEHPITKEVGKQAKIVADMVKRILLWTISDILFEPRFAFRYGCI